MRQGILEERREANCIGEVIDENRFQKIQKDNFQFQIGALKIFIRLQRRGAELVLCQVDTN